MSSVNESSALYLSASRKQKVLVPVLRFPEFSGEWQQKTLQDVIQLVSGTHLKPDEYSESPKASSIPYFTGPSDFTNNPKDISKWTVSTQKYAADGSTLLTVKGSGVGQIMFLNLPKVAMGRQLMSISSDTDSSKFIYYCLFMRKQHFEALASGNMIPGLSRPDILTIKVFFPYKEEQQKIAHFLTTVDTKIQQLQQKQTLLQQYKKGVMQQLFSQALRFKDDEGGDYPDWEEKRLGTIAAKVNQKNKNLAETCVLTNSAIQGIVSQQSYFDKDIANKDNLGGYYVVDKDDFVYNPRVSVHAPVGPIKRNKLKKGVMSPLYTVFRFIGSNLDYLEHYFNTTCWYQYLEGVANYGARHDRMNITGSDFMKMPIPLPTSEEQQKIAYFLTALDEKITQTTQQLEQAQTFKKGLLQQMFV